MGGTNSDQVGRTLGLPQTSGLSDADARALRDTFESLEARGLIRILNKSAANFYVVDGLTPAGKAALVRS